MSRQGLVPIGFAHQVYLRHLQACQEGDELFRGQVTLIDMQIGEQAAKWARECRPAL